MNPCRHLSIMLWEENEAEDADGETAVLIPAAALGACMHLQLKAYNKILLRIIKS